MSFRPAGGATAGGRCRTPRRWTTSRCGSTTAIRSRRCRAGTSSGGWHPHAYPKHYLSKYHAKYNENADALAKEEGYDNWVQAVWQKRGGGGDFRVEDLNTPSVKPWNHEEITTTYVLHVRNPYHFAIDPAGNQLPYIDRLRVETVADAETLNLKVISGELSVAAIGLSTPDFPLFKENEEAGNYQTLMWPRAAGAESFYAFNLTHQDPGLREVFQDVRFRQAMSLAINREEINKVLFFGLAVPRQAAMDPENSFYKEEWATRYAEYDPDTANRLLDEMGLQRGGDGFRLRPDGEVLAVQILIPLEWPSHVAISELVAEYWQDVGVKVDPRSYNIDLVGERLGTNDYDVAVWFLRRTNESKGYLPSNKFTSADGHYAPAWWAWHHSGGESGEEPPDEFKEYFQVGRPVVHHARSHRARPHRHAAVRLRLRAGAADRYGRLCPGAGHHEQRDGQRPARRSVRGRRRAVLPRRQARPVVLQAPVVCRTATDYWRTDGMGQERCRQAAVLGR